VIKLAILIAVESVITLGIGYWMNEMGTHPAYLLAWGYFCGATCMYINTSQTVSEW
jgi:hypothetical protein